MEAAGDVDGAIEMLSDAATDLQAVRCRTPEEVRLVQFRLAAVLRAMGEVQFRHAAATEEAVVAELEVIAEGAAVVLSVDERAGRVAARVTPTPGRVVLHASVMSNAIAAAENLGNAVEMFDSTGARVHGACGGGAPAGLDPRRSSGAADVLQRSGAADLPPAPHRPAPHSPLPQWVPRTR